MKFSVLSGSVKNAGDFLIVKRTIQLLKAVYPNCEIQTYIRTNNLSEYLQEINKSDALIFAGGPVFSPDIYPIGIPLIDDLKKITTRFFTIGLGWYAKNNLDSTVYDNYKFSSDTNTLVERMHKDAYISCRDWYTFRLLKNQGFNHLRMTGCPAWYSIEDVNNVNLRSNINYLFKNICISDPAYSINTERSFNLALYVREKFPSSEINFIFHRGIYSDKYTTEQRAQKNKALIKQLKTLNINIYDISYSAEGFNIYDNCDLHIGFRVHAHIYNLSKRNISILLEEDGRGCGANEALGLYGIKPYNYHYDKSSQSVHLKDNPYYIKSIDDYLFALEGNNYLAMKHAYRIMRDYYEHMISHIKSL